MVLKSRAIYFDILKQKNKQKVSIILGPRQVGKTTLLKFLHKELGGIFLDIDIYSNYQKISTYENFINFLRVNGYQDDQVSFFYLFLDEFQRYKDLTLVLKNIYDHHKNIKIYASGSSSLTIKNAVQESLAGRKQITHLYPLSFKEFLIFKDEAELLGQIDNLPGIISRNYYCLIPRAINLLKEFLVFGGYPEVILVKPKEKPEVLQNIFDLYIKKDIKDFLRVEKINSATTLIKQLAVNNGSIANYSKYGAQAELDIKTVKSYLEILKETFLINILSPFFSNKNKEIVKAPRVYFLDNGVRNWFYNNFNALDERNDAGFLFEGYYIGELIKYGQSPERIKYYRSKRGSEIDLVLDLSSRLIPVEIKYKSNLTLSDGRSLRKFMEEYKIDSGYLVNLGEIDREERIKKIDCFNLSYLFE